MKRHWAHAATLLLAMVGSTSALGHGEDHSRHAPQPSDQTITAPLWAELSSQQQEKLAQLRERWDAWPPARRAHVLDRMERRARWEALPPEQRERLRHGARNFQNLPPELRDKMRASMQAVRQLPEEERRSLKARWRAMDPEQRRRWLEAGGPGLAPPPEQ